MTKKILATQRNRILRIFKDTQRCCSCGFDKDASALQFHHIIPDDKTDEISKVMATGVYDDIIDELKKCAVICANCHQILHNSLNVKVVEEIIDSLVPVDTDSFEKICIRFNAILNEKTQSFLLNEDVESLIEDDNDFYLKGGPTTIEQKEWIYKIYLDTGRRKNETCRRVWGNTGGYTRYLNEVILSYESVEEYED